MNAFNFDCSSMKMEKTHRKHRCLFIIYYLRYAALIALGWQILNCISSFGVMSMDILNGSNELQTMITTAVHPSLTPLGMQATQKQESIPSISSDHTIDSSKLETIASNAFDTTPIEGWQCYCWNSTYEVIGFVFPFLPTLYNNLIGIQCHWHLFIVIYQYLFSFHLTFIFHMMKLMMTFVDIELSFKVQCQNMYYFTICILIHL